jgi:membrane-bound lytic murein transglycosylase F
LSAGNIRTLSNVVHYVKKKVHTLFFSLVFIAAFQQSCTSTLGEQKEEQTPIPAFNEDFDAIRQRGKLIVLTENTSVSFYLYRGQAMGYDYELIRKFAHDHDLTLEVKVLDDLNAMFERLAKGDGDLIACNLNISPDRQSLASFTTPLFRTRQVLVQRKSNDSLNFVSQWRHLNGKEVYVHTISTAFANLEAAARQQNVALEIIDPSGNLSSEKLIRLVAEGQIDYTVADENLAQLNATYYPNLDVSFAITEAQDVAWAVRKDADTLLTYLNRWLEDPKNQRRLKFTRNKYFEAVKSQQARVQSAYSSLDGKRISEYDEVIRKHSQSLQWDWRLLAAMIYEESRFNPEARSWAGAFGLMQLMPATAERFGIDTTQTREANIKAGVAYLRYLDRYWKKHIDDPEERVNFILASYNVGPGHVQDARAIAIQTGKTPNLWHNNVADCLLLKSEPEYHHLEGVKHGYCRCVDPVNYVSDVQRKFAEYRALHE